MLVPVALAKLQLSWGLDNRFIRGGVAGDIRWLDKGDIRWLDKEPATSVNLRAMLTMDPKTP